MSRIAADPVARFWASVDKTDGCWNWKRALNSSGYGLFRTLDRKMVLAHRFAYEQTFGPIDPLMVVDHTCRNRSCVNPQHLRLVTRKQNSENRARESEHGRSGIRGVHYLKHTGTWGVRVRHNGRIHSRGSHHTIEEAAEAVRLLRLELQTHNDVDR